MAEWKGREITHLWKLYEYGIDCQNKIGLRHTIPKNVDFYEGRQWPPPTEATKNLPRPVVNIVKMICRSKKSSILSTPVRIIYKSYAQGANTDKLNAFAETVLKELDQDGLDRLAVDDGIKKGSYFYHYYWDKDAKDQSGNTEGGVRCEIIDPLNIFFANPCELDEQKQKWILISSTLDAEDVCAMCDRDVSPQLVEDEEGAERLYNKESKKITVLTRYFRIGGEVYCERATKLHVINKPFKLCPEREGLLHMLREAEKKDPGNDNPESPSNIKGSDSDFQGKEDRETDTESKIKELFPFLTKKAEGCGLYPIVCGTYERREGSIYGISEVEAIIPNQKAINFNIAMSLLNAQQCAWGKYIALPNALKGQVISNSPGQVLIDHTGTGQGIKRMAEVGISQVPVDISEKITELTRLTSGANEILSSEALGSNLSGVAIAQLQAQAEVPLEELRAEFIKVKRKQGIVLAQFLRLYYFDRRFVRSSKEEAGKTHEICDCFTSDDYRNCVFDVIVEPTRGSRASITSDINLLDTCLKNGNISLETYITAYPEGVINNKHTILRQIEAEKTAKSSTEGKEKK